MVICRIMLSSNTVSNGLFCDVQILTSQVMMLHDSHKITKTVTKFWISIKRTDISHMCHVDTNKRVIMSNRVKIRGLPCSRQTISLAKRILRYVFPGTYESNELAVSYSVTILFCLHVNIYKLSC